MTYFGGFYFVPNIPLLPNLDEPEAKGPLPQRAPRTLRKTWVKNLCDLCVLGGQNPCSLCKNLVGKVLIIEVGVGAKSEEPVKVWRQAKKVG